MCTCMYMYNHTLYMYMSCIYVMSLFHSSLCFSLDSDYLLCSSDKATVHIFAVKDQTLNKKLRYAMHACTYMYMHMYIVCTCIYMHMVHIHV